MKLVLNLQLFAESEKTEEATPKKKRDARTEGRVLQSKEVTAVFMLLASFLALKIFGQYILESFVNFTNSLYLNIENVDILFHDNNLRINLLNTIIIFFKLVAPMLAIAFFAALIINYAQVGFLFTTKPLKLDLNKINPIEGFKRLFSKKAVMELFKSIFKIILVGYVGYSFIIDNFNRIINLPNFEIKLIIVSLADIAYNFAMRIILVMLVIAAADYFFQWRQHKNSLMMTKQEVKEEHKQTEGDPQIKSKIREKQRQVSTSRMMQEVPKADVIITNPTHIAIAIQYDKELGDAPYVIAKGVNIIAENIKKIAKDNSIPIVENKPMARMLYNTLDIGDFIPEELYEAVAEILAYVYSLKDKY